MTDPTTDIKDTFIAEMLIDSFEKFEESLTQRIAQHPTSGIKRTSGGIQSDRMQCSYKLDTNLARPCIRITIGEMQGERTKHEFLADAIGAGILNMRLVWRETGGGQLYSSDELAEFCFNELLAAAV